jgi:hypothetical protein
MEIIMNIPRYRIVPVRKNLYNIQYSYDNEHWEWVLNSWNGGLAKLDLIDEKEAEYHIDRLIEQARIKHEQEKAEKDWQIANPPRIYP